MSTEVVNGSVDFGCRLEEVTCDHVKDWLRSKRGQIASETIKGRLGAVVGFHCWGASEGKWDLNGMSRLRVGKVTSKVTVPLPLDAARALIAGCIHPLEFRLVYYPLFAGCRLFESAKMDAADWQDDYLCFIGKGAKYREVPIHPQLAMARSVIMEHGPIHKSCLYKVRNRLADRTGVFFRPHQLRKTWSTTLYDAEADFPVVRAMLGHETGVTTKHGYVEVTRRKKSREMLKLDYGGLAQLQLGFWAAPLKQRG